MIRHNCAQGTDLWHALHVGIPTSCCAKQIIQPVKMKPSSSQDALLDRLLSEWVIGRRIQGAETEWMDRGKDMEAAAVGWYEMAPEGGETEHVGFVTTDDGLIGCSPDRFVGEDGILEVKCPKIETHLGYVRSKKLPDEYRPQVQWQLWVCERKWCDFLSYNPRIEPIVIRVFRDEPFIDALKECVAGFIEKLKAGREELLARGSVPTDPMSYLPEDPDTGLTEDPMLGEHRSYGKALEAEGVVQGFDPASEEYH